MGARGQQAQRRSRRNGGHTSPAGRPRLLVRAACSSRPAGWLLTSACARSCRS